MRYYTYSEYMRHTLGDRVQKLCIDGGFTCPNRDGTVGTGGCTFCNNNAFCPSYITDTRGETCQQHRTAYTSRHILQQINEGIAFHQRRYRNTRRYLAYFQAYSGTHAPLHILQQRYEEALSHPNIEGLVIGTRPDCIDNKKLDYLAHLATRCHITIEYGIESCYNRTLALVNRGHTMEQTIHAIEATAQHGLHCGGHLILGLPGESREDIIAETAILNTIPLNSIKLHQLQILHGTPLQQQIERGEVIVPVFSLNDYIALACDFLERLRPDIAIERLAGEVPPRYQAQPERAFRRSDNRLLRNEEMPRLVQQELTRRNSWQGMLLGAPKPDINIK